MTAGGRQTATLVGLLVLAALTLILRLLIDRPPGGTIGLAWPEPDYASFRMTAAGTGALVGAALAISGLLLQVMLRNALASPFVLGVSGGAGLGVIVALYLEAVLGWSWMAAGGQLPPALLGALITLVLVYGLGQRRGWLDPLSLVLVGMIVAAMCGALIMFFQHLVPHGLRGDLIVWLMGSIPEQVPAGRLGLVSVIVLGAAIMSGRLGRAMDAATLGDEEATSVGLALGPLRLMMFLMAGVLAAVAVALAGPIGFVGLVSPHLARLLMGPRHGPLVLASALLGIIIVVGADVARQGLDFGAGRMPIGVFTALLGGPTFIWLLRTGRGRV